MSEQFHTSQPIDCGGVKISGTEVIDSSGAIIGDIQATAGSIGTTELADAGVTSAKLDDSTIQYAELELDATTIVGTTAGDIAATAGFPLVAAPGADECLEFISAVLFYEFDTAAYTGGGDDVVIRQGTTAVTPAIAGADLLEDSADDIVFLPSLATDVKLTLNSTLNLFAGTALTQPGTAAGTLRVKVAYRVHTGGYTA